jgi:hypothetical protein
MVPLVRATGDFNPISAESCPAYKEEGGTGDGSAALNRRT